MLKVFWSHFRRSKFVNDSFYAVFGNAMGSAIFLLAGIIIARFLGKDVYGEYGMVKSTMFSIAAFATFGMYSTSTKYIAEYMRENRTQLRGIIRGSLSISLLFSGSMACLLFVFSGQLADYLGHDYLRMPLRYLSIIVVSKSFNQTQLGILAGFKLYKYTSRTNVLSGFSMSVIGVPLAWAFGLSGALAGLLTSQLTQVVANHLLIRRELRKINVKQENKGYFQELVAFSFPVAIQGAISPLSSWCITLMITKLSTLGQLGIYSAAAQWNAIILMVPQLLYNVVLSHLSTHSNSHEQQNKLVNRMILVNLGCTLSIFIIVYIAAPWIASSYGPTFTGLVSVMRILVFSTIFACMSNVLMASLIATRKRWQSLSIVLTTAIIANVTLYILFVRHHGENAAQYMAIVHVINSIISCGMMYIYYRNNLRKQRRLEAVANK